MALYTYYVNSATGSDANTGGSGDPWQTLEYAMTAVSLPAVVYFTGSETPSASFAFPAGTSTLTTPLAIIGGTITCTNFSTWPGDGKYLRFFGTQINSKATTNFWVPGNNVFDKCTLVDLNAGVARVAQYSYCLFQKTSATSFSADANFIGCTLDNVSVYARVNRVITRCVFKNGAYITAPFNGAVIDHCSFSDGGYIYLWNNNQSTHTRVSACVFEGSSPFDAITTASGGYVSVRDCVLGANATLLQSGLGRVEDTDDTITVASAFADVNFTPSSELSAITGSDGLTPGAIQASEGGGVRIPNIRGGADQ